MLAFTLAAGPLGAAPDRVVLVTIDGLSSAGLPGPGSFPTLDSLAARGLRVRGACSPSTLPFPALATVLSGCGPARTRVTDEATLGLPGDVPTLALSLGSAGFRGVALPSDALAHAGSGLARGFERFAADAPALPDSARVDSALAWLRREGRRFVWLALSFGYPPEVWRRGDGLAQGGGDALASRARELDAALARLVAGLPAGREGGTLLAVTGTCAAAAPGNEATTADDRAARVPVVISGPGVPRGRSVEAADLADLAPTLAAAAGARASGFDGGNLLKRARGPGGCPPAHDGARGERSAIAVPAALGPAFRAALRASASPDSAALAAWDSLGVRAPDNARIALERAVTLSRGGREQAAALGFQALIEAHPAYPEAAIAYAEHLLRFQRYEQVRGVLGAIPEQSPLAALAKWRLALAYAGQMDFVAALGVAERAGALAAPNAAALGTPAALRRLGALGDSTALVPGDADLRIRFGRALGDMGYFDAAYQQFHQARARAPGRAEPDYWLAAYLLRQGRPQHAAPTLERALEAEPGYRPARLALAEALMELGRRREAREQLERALEQGPLAAREEYNLACLRATEGDAAGALEALERAIAQGYEDRERLERDPDLESLRGEERFRRLLDAMR